MKLPPGLLANPDFLIAKGRGKRREQLEMLIHVTLVARGKCEEWSGRHLWPAAFLARVSSLRANLVDSKVPERSRFGTESFDQEEMVSKKCAGARSKKARSRACAPDWALGNQYFVASSRLPGFKLAVRENRGPENEPHAG